MEPGAAAEGSFVEPVGFKAATPHFFAGSADAPAPPAEGTGAALDAAAGPHFFAGSDGRAPTVGPHFFAAGSEALGAPGAAADPVAAAPHFLAGSAERAPGLAAEAAGRAPAGLAHEGFADAPPVLPLGIGFKLPIGFGGAGSAGAVDAAAAGAAASGAAVTTVGATASGAELAKLVAAGTAGASVAGVATEGSTAGAGAAAGCTASAAAPVSGIPLGVSLAFAGKSLGARPEDRFTDAAGGPAEARADTSPEAAPAGFEVAGPNPPELSPEPAGALSALGIAVVDTDVTAGIARAEAGGGVGAPTSALPLDVGGGGCGGSAVGGAAVAMAAAPRGLGGGPGGFAGPGGLIGPGGFGAPEGPDGFGGGAPAAGPVGFAIAPAGPPATEGIATIMTSSTHEHSRSSDAILTRTWLGRHYTILLGGSPGGS